MDVWAILCARARVCLRRSKRVCASIFETLFLPFQLSPCSCFCFSSFAVHVFIVDAFVLDVVVLRMLGLCCAPLWSTEAMRQRKQVLTTKLQKYFCLVVVDFHILQLHMVTSIYVVLGLCVR